MFKDNLISLRKLHGYSQDELAEKIGVTRQTLSKYETGESLPDIERCKRLADIFGVSLDDLVNYEKTDRENVGLEVPPKGKHVFGMVKVGDKGQIVIPANARKIFDIQPGDNLLILGDEEQGIAILKEKSFLEHLRLMERLRHMESGEKSDPAENALPAPNTAKLSMIYPQQRIHLLRCILVTAVLVMYQNVVRFPDLPGGLLTKAAYRSSQCKDPNGGTDRHMVILRQIDAQGSNGHCPAVHPIASAPPETQCSLCALRGTNFIECGTCPIRFFHRLLFYIAHPGKIDHQPFGVRSDVRIIAFLNIKLLLPIKYPCGISGRSLTEADHKKRRRHEIQREHIKLDADPQHERHTEDASCDNANSLFGKQQPGGGQVREAIYNQQCVAGKGEILKDDFCKRQYLKIGEHGIHPHPLSAGVQQHPKGTAYCADRHKECPENQ